MTVYLICKRSTGFIKWTRDSRIKQLAKQAATKPDGANSDDVFPCTRKALWPARGEERCRINIFFLKEVEQKAMKTLFIERVASVMHRKVFGLDRAPKETAEWEPWDGLGGGGGAPAVAGAAMAMDVEAGGAEGSDDEDKDGDDSSDGKAQPKALLIIDEAHRVLPQGDSRKTDTAFVQRMKILLKQGRKHGFGVVLLTQKWNKLHSEIRGEMATRIQGRFAKKLPIYKSTFSQDLPIPYKNVGKDEFKYHFLASLPDEKSTKVMSPSTHACWEKKPRPGPLSCLELFKVCGSYLVKLKASGR